jgi:hypothetical protein
MVSEKGEAVRRRLDIDICVKKNIIGVEIKFYSKIIVK